MSVKTYLATRSGKRTSAIVILLAFGLFAWWMTQRQDAGMMVAKDPKPTATPTVAEQGAEQGAETKTVLTMPGAVEPAAGPEAKTGEPEPEAAPAKTAGDDVANDPGPVEEKAEPVAPSFDLVRVDEEGDAVLAGRAEPGAEVEILVDGEVVAETTASGKGEFVATATLKVTAETQEMTIRAKSPSFEIVSADPILILGRPVAETPDVAAEGLSEAGRTASASLATTPSINPPTIRTAPDPNLDANPDVVASAPVVAATAEAGAAPIIAQTSLSGVSLLQPPQLQASDTVTLDAISYSKVGDVRLSGRGHPGRIARIYANDKAVAEALIGADGSWKTELSDVMKPGRYVLRVDEIDADGRVTSRVESPFQREYVTDVQALDSKYIVQPGNSLWRIARVSYGRGVEYTVIYDANRDRIKDPDLIYPGQIFELPNRE